MPVPFLFWLGREPTTTAPPVVVPPPIVPPGTVDASLMGRGFVPYCDRCGFVYKLSDLEEDWQGLLLCQPCYEPRHIGDFMPSARPDAPRATNVKREISTESAAPTYIASNIGVQS